MIIKETGEPRTGKFAFLEADKVGLFLSIMSDKKGGFRGCGKKRIFEVPASAVKPDDPAKEIKQRRRGLTGGWRWKPRIAE